MNYIIKKTKRIKQKSYTEAEISKIFNLDKIKPINTLMSNWLNTSTTLDIFEQHTFDKILHRAIHNIEAWNEEDLKMNFISYVIDLSNLEATKTIRTFYEKTIDAEVDGVYLKTKTDFMIASGLLDLMDKPYFHFQEYKKDKQPNGDPLGQLLEAFLIAQAINSNGKPIYGAYIVGRYWYFVTMENKQYCVSKSFDSTEQDNLIQIIAVLRHFKVIMETTLIDKDLVD